MSNTQLTSANGYETSNMIFSKPEKGTIPGSGLTYMRVKIGTKYSDGTSGDLIISTDGGELYSFGTQENKSPDGKVNGHVLPLCMWDRDGPTKTQKATTDTIDSIVDRCVDWLLKNKDQIERYDLEKADLKKLNPLYWKREKGKIVEGRGPTLYSKLIESKKNGILTTFFDSETDEEIDPLSLKTHCFVVPAIRIESIFIGNKISLQVKLYEAVVRTLDKGRKSLLRPNAKKTVVQTNSIENALGGDESDLEEEDKQETVEENSEENSDGSLEDSDEEQEEEKPQTPVKKKKTVKRKVVRKKN
jgi:hypothetical protein